MERPFDIKAFIRLMVRMIIRFTMFGCLLFVPAGTIAWPQGWVMLGITFAFLVPLFMVLSYKDPELVRERSKGLFAKGQKKWDIVWAMFFLPTYLAWLPLAGLDAVRFHWSHVPLWLQITGGVVYAIATALICAVFFNNTFLSPVVRIQEERGQKLVDTGLYGIVRHPMYGAIVFMLPGGSLLLGSWCALGISGVLILLFAVRTIFEEKTLSEELPGYKEYKQKVPYRWIPWVW